MLAALSLSDVAEVAFWRKHRRYLLWTNWRPRFHGDPQGLRSTAGIWLPFPSEVAGCCKHITRPQARYPWALYRHCCTAKHIAEAFDVPHKDLASAVKLLEATHAPLLEQGKAKEEGDKLLESTWPFLPEPKEDDATIFHPYESGWRPKPLPVTPDPLVSAGDIPF